MTRILIVRFSSIGDVVLTTPVVRCLKTQWKGELEIHYLTKKSFSNVLEANPHIDKIHAIDSNVDEVMDDLRAFNFDYLIDLHHNIRTSQVKSKLKVKAFTFNKLNVQKWFLVHLKMNRMPDIHIVDRYMETVSSLGIKNDGKGLDHFIPEKEQLSVEALPESHQNGYLAWAIGGAHVTKILPTEKIISIAKNIDKPIVLLGGNADVEAGQKIADAVGENIFNACGKFSIHQSAWMVQHAQKVLTNDTGMMHIAAAFKQDILSFWGNTVPGFGMYPYLPEGSGASKIMELEDMKCRPCSKIGYKSCPKKHFKCMLSQNETAVIEWANS